MRERRRCAAVRIMYLALLLAALSLTSAAPSITNDQPPEHSKAPDYLLNPGCLRQLLIVNEIKFYVPYERCEDKEYILHRVLNLIDLSECQDVTIMISIYTLAMMEQEDQVELLQEQSYLQSLDDHVEMKKTPDQHPQHLEKYEEYFYDSEEYY